MVSLLETATDVITFAVHLSVGSFDANRLSVSVDKHNLRACANVDVETTTKGFWRLKKESVAVGNSATYIVWQTAIRV